jgi:polar amino acid transport system permease protein
VTSDRRAARDKARLAKTRRGQAIAAFSTLIVIGGLLTLVLTSSGWPAVKDTFFNIDVFKADFPDILRAFWLDIKMFVVIEVIVLILGLVVALIRTSTAPALFPFRILAAVFCDFFRGIPVIILIYLFGFGIPALDLGVTTNPIILGGAALVLAYSAYVAEVYRAGIFSVHSGQMDAALAMGLTRTQAMRHVILPQAIRRVRPPLLNDFISLQKDVALVYVLGITEAFRVAQVFSYSNFNYTPLIAVSLLYLIVTVPLSRILDSRISAGQIPT